jgi:Ni,Fe-hydrogenase III large subunit
MGIINNELANFSLSSYGECHIELIEGDVIHLHIGGLRMDMSKEEFEQFAEVISEGKHEFDDIKQRDVQ